MTIELKQICPDFDEWPERWMGVSDDIEYGKGIINLIEPFIEDLASKKLSIRTLKNHIDNLWLLGGELIRQINQDESNRAKEPLELMMINIGLSGGPSCKHIQNEQELESYNATCKALYEFFQHTGNIK